MKDRAKIGLIGGTGPFGRGLGLRFAMAGDEVFIGSRDPSRAHTVAREIAEAGTDLRVSGSSNEEVALGADVVFLTVAFEGHETTVKGLQGYLDEKIVVDAVVPLDRSLGRFRSVIVEQGSAAEQAQALLPKARVIGAFHTISAKQLLVPNHSFLCDVFVCGDDAPAKRLVMAQAEKIVGVRAIDGEGLVCSRYVEGMVALMLNINRVYKSDTSIKLIGI